MRRLWLLLALASCKPASPPPNEADTDADADTDTDADADADTDTDTDADPGDPAVDDDGDGLSEDEGDCDDTDETIRPEALETLGDGIDSDCDGRDTAAWGYGSGRAWEDPNRPRVARMDSYYAVAASGRWSQHEQMLDPAIVFLFRPDLTVRQAVDEWDAHWANVGATLPVGPGTDLVASGNQLWVAGTLYVDGPEPAARMIVYQLELGTMPWLFTFETTIREVAWPGALVDLDLVLDSDGFAWAVASGGGGRAPGGGTPDGTTPNKVIALSVETPFTSAAGQQDIQLLAQFDVGTANEAGAVFVQPDPSNDSGLITTCDSDGCTSIDADLTSSPGTLTPSTTTTWDGESVREADNHAGLLLSTHPTNGATVRDGPDTYSLFAAEELISFDAMWHDGTLYAVAVVAGSPNTIELRWGDPAAPGGLANRAVIPTFDPDPVFEHQPRPPGCDPALPGCTTGRNLDAQAVSIHVDDDRIAIAMSALSMDQPTAPLHFMSTEIAPQDAIGWMFMAHPP